MTAAELLISTMWIGLTAYVLLAGADFGAGFWDLLAGKSDTGHRQRDLIEHTISPVWEANHVWLIFVIVLCWSGFPGVFAAVASTMYIPLTLVAIGIIARGAAFAFRKVSTELGHRKAYGAAFASSSVLTPFFLGTVAGGIASARVPPGIAQGSLVTSWINPTSIMAGLLAVGTTAYLSAVYLCGDARREGADAVAEAFRRKSIASGAVTGIVAMAGIVVLRFDAPALYDGLLRAGYPFVFISAGGGLLSMALLWYRIYLYARITAAAAVAALPWGWALAQYPLVLLPSTTIADAAATPAVLHAVLISTLIGAVLLVPSLVWLFALFQREQRPAQREN